MATFKSLEDLAALKKDMKREKEGKAKHTINAIANRNIGYTQINLQLFLLFSQIRCSAFLQNALPRLITANILNRSLNFMAFATTPYALPSAIFLS